MELAGQEQQQPQRRDVGPVQIVEDDHQRPDRRSFAQVGRCRVVGAEAHGGLVTEDAVARLVRTGQHGEDRLAPAAVPRQRADHLDPGPVARRALALPAGPPHGDRAACLRVRGRFGGERGLTDAGLAGQEYDSARAGHRGIDGRMQRVNGQPPPDQHICRHTPLWTAPAKARGSTDVDRVAWRG